MKRLLTTLFLAFITASQAPILAMNNGNNKNINEISNDDENNESLQNLNQLIKKIRVDIEIYSKESEQKIDTDKQVPDHRENDNNVVNVKNMDTKNLNNNRKTLLDNYEEGKKNQKIKMVTDKDINELNRNLKSLDLALKIQRIEVCNQKFKQLCKDNELPLIKQLLKNEEEFSYLIFKTVVRQLTYAYLKENDDLFIIMCTNKNFMKLITANPDKLFDFVSNTVYEILFTNTNEKCINYIGADKVNELLQKAALKNHKLVLPLLNNKSVLKFMTNTTKKILIINIKPKLSQPSYRRSEEARAILYILNQKN